MTLVANIASTNMAAQVTAPFSRGADMLPLRVLAQASATQASIAAYDFREHMARFNHVPEPRYVLIALRDILVDTQLTISYSVQPATPVPAPLTLTIHAGTLAGSSLLLDLGSHEGSTTRLTQLMMSPAAADGEAANQWGLLALLGNTAKMLWVLGWERDYLRRQLAHTTSQRQLGHALGLSLDLIGYDLGIPRFPPLPYSFDSDTIALYHLNDQVGANPNIEDITGRYPGQTGHPGTISGAVSLGVPGRFGTACALQSASAAINIAPHNDFNLNASQSFSIECFVQPARNAVDGHILSKHPDPASNQAGWALSVGEFGRGLPLNPRWLISDGANPPIVLFADRSLSFERFTHLAAVIDRQHGLARLYVDGQLVSQAGLGALQAMTNAEPLRIGHPSAALLCNIEEVRLSRMARTSFNPALGESDQSYRQRLRFFRRWVLPTPSTLLDMLNEAIGPINGDTAPLIVNDHNTSIIGGARTITIDPVSLLPGQTIDLYGRLRVKERDICGTTADEPLFDVLYLVTHNDARVNYVPAEPRTLQPNEPAPDPHKMQLVVERSLNRLLDLAAAEAAAGKLSMQSAFDPRAADLRATGRGLLCSHTTIATGRLAALAQQAGFSFVQYRDDLDAVYVSCILDEYLEILITPAPALQGLDGQLGDILTLSVRPALPADTSYRWLSIACGIGQVRFTGSTTAASTTIQVNAAGNLALKVDVSRRRNTISATRSMHLGPKDLANATAIGSDGSLGVNEDVAGTADSFFHPALLVQHNDPRASYGADPNNHLMQASVAARLTRLLDLLAEAGIAGSLQIVSSYNPAATDLTAVGRGLTLKHSSINAGQLAALAYAAGFSYMRRQNPNLIIRQASDELVHISGPQRLEQGKAISLSSAVKATDLGAGVRLQWTLAVLGQAQAHLSSTTQPNVTLTGVQAGQVSVQLRYLIGDNPAPYTFEVRLKPVLEASQAVIRKEQYDLIMNILNTFHPIGVEVSTRALRERVVELQGGGLDANPDYTYPKFHVRGPVPRQRKEHIVG